MSSPVSPLDREPPDRDPWAETPWTETPLVGQRPLLLDRDPSCWTAVGHQLSRAGSNILFAKFSQNLHEIERIWTPGGSLTSPLDPPLMSAPNS